jgi:hypothetical protein
MTAEWSDPSEDKARRQRRAAAAAVGACGVRDAAKKRAGDKEAAPKKAVMSRTRSRAAI